MLVGKVPQKLRLTDRDQEILKWLSDQGVATFEELRSSFFSSQDSCKKRLSLLVKSGIIESISATQIKSVSSQSLKNFSLILGTGISDLHKYKVYRLSPKLRKLFPSVSEFTTPVMWAHQIELNKIRRFLEAEIGTFQVLTDIEQRAEYSRFQIQVGKDLPIPDLLINKNGFKIAVEIERNLKNKREFVTRLIHFESAKIDRIIYFCANEKIFETLNQMGRTFQKVGFSTTLKPNTVFSFVYGVVPIKKFLSLE